MTRVSLAKTNARPRLLVLKVSLGCVDSKPDVPTFGASPIPEDVPCFYVTKAVLSRLYMLWHVIRERYSTLFLAASVTTKRDNPVARYTTELYGHRALTPESSCRSSSSVIVSPGL